MVEAIRQAVEAYACHVHGVRYGFELKWAAAEQHSDPRQARYLLNVELVAIPGGAPVQSLQLLVRITELSEVAALLEDALFHYLADQLVVEGDVSRIGPRELGRCVFPSASVRSN